MIIPVGQYESEYANKFENKDSSISQSIHFFKVADDTLKIIRDELIEATGGYTENGDYYNSPAINYVNNYFYGKTFRRNNASKIFFKTIDRLCINISAHYPKSTFEKNFNYRINALINNYGLESREALFKDLSIHEAVLLIEFIRADIALEQLVLIISMINDG